MSTAVVDKSYKGPRLGGVDEKEVTLDFVKEMVEEFKAQRTIHKRCAPGVSQYRYFIFYGSVLLCQ